MRIEEVIGRNMRRTREERGLSQSELGQAIERQQGRPWSRQAVSAAEKGQRAFSAADLMALARELDVSIPALFLLGDAHENGSVEIAYGVSVGADEYQRRILHDLDVRGPAQLMTSSDVKELDAAVSQMRKSHERAAVALSGLETSLVKAAQVVHLAPVTDADITPEQWQQLRDDYEERTGEKLGPDDVVDWITGELRKS